MTKNDGVMTVRQICLSKSAALKMLLEMVKFIANRMLGIRKYLGAILQ